MRDCPEKSSSGGSYMMPIWYQQDKRDDADMAPAQKSILPHVQTLNTV